MTLTQAEIDEGKRLCEAATPGEWEYVGIDDDDEIYVVRAESAANSLAVAECQSVHASNYDNAAFIAASRSLLPRALAEIERLREALVIIADNDTWDARKAARKAPGRKP